MQSEVLVALISRLVEDRVTELLESFNLSTRGPRGFRGARGEDGFFKWEEHEEKIRQLIRDSAIKFSDFTEEQIQLLKGPQGIQGSAGLDGKDGRDGKDFLFDEHTDKINKIISSELQLLSPQLKLKFEDLTEDEVAKVRGPRGARGQRGPQGETGKSFEFSEHEEKINSVLKKIVDELSPKLKLKFEDLTSDEIEILLGPSGKDGKDFSLPENERAIRDIISDLLKTISPELKLKYKDLTQEELESLRGARGPRGRDGKGFVFEEHEEFFNTIKTKFSDFTDEEILQLKLKFSDLSSEEKECLKLKFSDLTEEDKIVLRGPRGQRGRSGRDGVDGKDGLQGIEGPRGKVGPIGRIGLTGLPGRDGKDGRDGINAPTIEEFNIVEHDDAEISFNISLSNGKILHTDKVKMPSKQIITQQVVAASSKTIRITEGSGGGTTPEDLKMVYEHDCSVLLSNVPKESDPELEIIAATAEDYSSVTITNLTNRMIVVYKGTGIELTPAFLIGAGPQTYTRNITILEATRLSIKSANDLAIVDKKFFLEFNGAAV